MDMTIRNMVTEYLKFCQFRKELDEKTLKAYRNCRRSIRYAFNVFFVNLGKSWTKKH